MHADGQQESFQETDRWRNSEKGQNCIPQAQALWNRRWGKTRTGRMELPPEVRKLGWKRLLVESQSL